MPFGEGLHIVQLNPCISSVLQGEQRARSCFVLCWELIEVSAHIVSRMYKVINTKSFLCGFAHSYVARDCHLVQDCFTFNILCINVNKNVNIV